MGSELANSVFGKCQDPIRMFLESQGEAMEQASPLKRLFLMGKDSSYAATITGMTAFRGFQAVGEGGEYPKDETQEGYAKTINHVTWKDSFAVTKEVMEDNRLLDLTSRPKAFIKGHQRAREEFGAALYAGAMEMKKSITVKGGTFDLTGADGVTIFNKAHPSKVGKSSQSNVFSDPFSAAALGKLETRMQNFVGDAGNLLDVAPTTILIPNDADAKDAVFSAIGADKDPATSNNAFNYQFGRWNVICWPYLNKYLSSYTDFPWILLDEEYNQSAGGAVWFDRVELEMRSVIAHNDDNEWLGRARWGAGFNDWRFAAVGGVSGGEAL
jgi:hypothetical protein